jgi:hypothetical protein
MQKILLRNLRLWKQGRYQIARGAIGAFSPYSNATPTHSGREKPQCPAHRLVDWLFDQLNHDALRLFQRRVMHGRVRGVRRVDPVQVFEVIAHLRGDGDAVTLARTHGQHGFSDDPASCTPQQQTSGGRM